MIRSLKALGLSLVAVLAFSAVIASAAQAEGKFVSEGEVTESFEAVPVEAPSALRIGNGSRTIRCSGESLTAPFPAPTETVNLTPGYPSGCLATGSTPTVITQNGCTYVWTIVTTTTGTEAIKCPVGAEIGIRIYENATKQAEGISLCEYGIPAQGPLPGLQFSNVGSGKTAHVNVRVETGGITVNSFKGSAILCGIAAGKSGILGKSGSLNAVVRKAGVLQGVKIS